MADIYLRFKLRVEVGAINYKRVPKRLSSLTESETTSHAFRRCFCRTSLLKPNLWGCKLYFKTIAKMRF